jgi:predicted GNAT family acetyltransferase
MRTGITVRNNAESGSYDALLAGRVVGVIIYERQGSRAIFRHTIVDPKFRGHGVGADLVRGALDDLVAKGLSLTNYCSFVTDFMASNPGYADVLDPIQPAARAVPAPPPPASPPHG